MADRKETNRRHRMTPKSRWWREWLSFFVYCVSSISKKDLYCPIAEMRMYYMVGLRLRLWLLLGRLFKWKYMYVYLTLVVGEGPRVRFLAIHQTIPDRSMFRHMAQLAWDMYLEMWDIHVCSCFSWHSLKGQFHEIWGFFNGYT